jgi:hypothetical protein
MRLHNIVVIGMDLSLSLAHAVTGGEDNGVFVINQSGTRRSALF